MSMKTELVFIRHGKTEWNEQKRYIGITDMPLSDNGALKIRELAKAGTYPDVDIVFISPMLRCKETANIIYPKAEVISIDEYKGRLEGKTFEELSDDPVYMRWVESGGKTDFPGYEDKDAYIDRVLEGYDRMTDIIRSRADISRAAIICHGGTIMSIMSKDDRSRFYEFMVENGGVIRCLVDL